MEVISNLRRALSSTLQNSLIQSADLFDVFGDAFTVLPRVDPLCRVVTLQSSSRVVATIGPFAPSRIHAERVGFLA